MKNKQNCWEYMSCGRVPGGSNVAHFGVCPVYQEIRLDGVHDGKNAGRACWVVAGTFCGGKVQGAFASKYGTCKECRFYQKVLTENYHNIEISLSLLERLRA